jgi:hypothetical protein
LTCRKRSRLLSGAKGTTFTCCIITTSIIGIWQAQYRLY